MSKTLLVKELVRHGSWVYSDYDNDQIKCKCGWVSEGFTPRTEEKAAEVFATHQLAKIEALL